jgi:hypothetical protein
VVVVVVTAVVVATAEGVCAIIFIIAFAVLDQVVVIRVMHVASLLAGGVVVMPLGTGNDRAATSMFVASPFRVITHTLFEEVFLVPALVAFNSGPLAASVWFAATSLTILVAPEIALEGILGAILVGCGALITMFLEVVAAVLVSAANLVRTQGCIIALALPNERVITGIRLVALLITCCNLVVPVVTGDDIATTCRSVAVRFRRTIDILKEELFISTVFPRSLPILARDASAALLVSAAPIRALLLPIHILLLGAETRGIVRTVEDTSTAPMIGAFGIATVCATQIFGF